MVEPLTVAGVGMTVLGSSKLLDRLLGPTADYIGEGLRNAVQRRSENIDRVFMIAVRKLGDQIESDGGVNPRVLKNVIEEAAFCEDALVAEYIGGVLATSRLGDLRDDRGVCFLSDIKSLSANQLRTHYLAYSSIVYFGCRHQCNPESWFEDDSNSITIYWSDDSYCEAMEYGPGQRHQQIARLSFLGLQNRGLSRHGLSAFEPYEYEQGDSDITTSPWRYFWATQYGYELFAWAIGRGDLQLRSYFDLKPSDLPNDMPRVEVKAIELGNEHRQGKIRND